MKIWLSAAFVASPRLKDLALAAEAAGIHGLAFADHICTPARIESPYPYTANQKATIPVGEEFPEPLIASAALGAVTSTLRFAPHVLVLPVRHPIHVAKQVATIQQMIGGRLELGVGAGWMQEEFDAVGVPFESRGARLDESIEVMRKIWTGEVVEHHGSHYDFNPLSVNPSPAEHVTLVGGGHTPAALRRAARLCDAWAAIAPSVEELGGLLESLHEARERAGTADREFEIRSGTKGRLTPERIKGMASLGVDAIFVGQWQIVTGAASIYEIRLDDVIARLPEVVDLVQSSI